VQVGCACSATMDCVDGATHCDLSSSKCVAACASPNAVMCPCVGGECDIGLVCGSSTLCIENPSAVTGQGINWQQYPTDIQCQDDIDFELEWTYSPHAITYFTAAGACTVCCCCTQADLTRV
jgi:hypothetical protein